MLALIFNLAQVLLIPGAGRKPELYLKDAADGATGLNRLLLLETGDALLLE